MKTKKEIQDENDKLKKELELAVSKSGTSISNCHINIDLDPVECANSLAEAMIEQAKANKSLSDAMNAFANNLKPTDICAIKIN